MNFFIILVIRFPHFVLDDVGEYMSLESSRGRKSGEVSKNVKREFELISVSFNTLILYCLIQFTAKYTRYQEERINF